MFVRSFNGFSAFGIFSPLDFMRLLTLTSELLTHIWVLSCLTFGGTPLSVILLSLTLSALPSLLPWLTGRQNGWDQPCARFEAPLVAKQEAMQRLVRTDANRPEIMLFDLGPWILTAWSRARKALLGLERRQNGFETDLSSRLFSRVYWSGMFSAFQNVSISVAFDSRSLTCCVPGPAVVRSTLDIDLGWDVYAIPQHATVSLHNRGCAFPHTPHGVPGDIPHGGFLRSGSAQASSPTGCFSHRSIPMLWYGDGHRRQVHVRHCTALFVAKLSCSV